MGYINWLKDEVRTAVSEFWALRDEGNGVLSGKTLDPFYSLIEKVVIHSGLTNAEIHYGRMTSQLPGYFRPHKAWDAVVIDNGQLVAAIELKSQVGSIGNNFNNRSEEVLGSSIDLQTAIEELAFGENTDIFTGYLILVEKSKDSIKTPTIEMKYFPVMEGFLLNEEDRGTTYRPLPDGTYPKAKGISYLQRYDTLCKRLMLKKLYSAAAVIAAPNSDHKAGNYESLSHQTSVETFFLKLTKHCEVVASMKSMP